jgi:ATP-binding cassette, subfamily C (CFTR/MRP), member 1
MSIAAPTLVSVAVVAAGLLSYLEDQRSIRPSDLLVIYLSVSTLLSLPVVRSYWIILASTNFNALAIITTLLTAVLVVVESVPRAHLQRPVGKGESKEQLVGFWSRGFFVWALPFLLQGYSSILTLAQVPGVDRELKEDTTWARLQGYWECTYSGRYKLLRATYLSHWRLLISAVPPRLALSAFTFCQPFLISSSVSYLTVRPSGSGDAYFGPALVFAFVLVYLGIAVRRSEHDCFNLG